MTDRLPTLAADLASALRRVLPYANLLPATVVDDVREALTKYAAHCSIVQTPGVRCNHESYGRDGEVCTGCGERVS